MTSYLEQWLLTKRKIRPTTVRGYESHVRLYLQPHLGRVLLAELRPHHLDAMYFDLLSSEQRGSATVQRIHATLRSALNSAVKRRLLPWNPALHVELPTADKPGAAVWTGEQLGEFLDAVRDHRTYAFFHLIGLAGLRRGEALGLRWEDVDLDRDRVRIVQQLVDTGRGLAFGPPTTRSGVRSVVLDTATAQALRNIETAKNRSALSGALHGSIRAWSSPERTAMSYALTTSATCLYA